MKNLKVMWHLGMVVVELGCKNLVLLIRKIPGDCQRHPSSSQNPLHVSKKGVPRQLLSMMQQEDVCLETFQSMAKRIKDNLTPDQRDDLVDEIFLLISKHTRESKKPKYPSATSTILVAPGNNLGIGGWRAYNNQYNHPSSTPMQRMPVY